MRSYTAAVAEKRATWRREKARAAHAQTTLAKRGGVRQVRPAPHVSVCGRARALASAVIAY